MKALVVVLIVAFTACGGRTVAPAAYVRSVCGAATTWQQDIQQRAQILASDLGGTPSPQQGKRAFGDFLDDLITSTGTLIDRVQEAGAPDLEDGAQAADKLLGALHRVQDAFQSARDQVEQASTESLDAFEQDASEINTSIQSGLDGIDDPFQGNAAELKSIFEKDPACRELSGG